ncbi:hypothetical protein D1641_11255 [Colidextribacter sp. OB.20]|nr:hypothetical protein [Colidextribacter sp. OB.20]
MKVIQDCMSENKHRLHTNSNLVLFHFGKSMAKQLHKKMLHKEKLLLLSQGKQFLIQIQGVCLLRSTEKEMEQPELHLRLHLLSMWHPVQFVLRPFLR